MSIVPNSSKFGRGVGSFRSRAQSLSQSGNGNRVRNGSIGRNSVRSEHDAHDAKQQQQQQQQQRDSQITRELTHQSSSISEGGRAKLPKNIVSSDEDDDGGIFSSDAESEGEAVRCRKCGSTSFRAKQRRGEHKLVCVK